MAKRRKRRASPNWKIARRQYEEGLSVEEIAEDHGVREKTVQKHIDADGWVSQETIQPARGAVRSSGGGPDHGTATQTGTRSRDDARASTC